MQKKKWPPSKESSIDRITSHTKVVAEAIHKIKEAHKALNATKLPDEIQAIEYPPVPEGVKILKWGIEPHKTEESIFECPSCYTKYIATADHWDWTFHGLSEAYDISTTCPLCEDIVTKPY